MASGNPFGFNVFYLLFLLVPGYAALRAYLRASVQLDSMSRLDKILSVAIGGGFSLIIMLVLNRFGVLNWVVIKWYDIWPAGYSIQTTQPIIYPRFEYAITADEVNSHTALSLMGFIIIQSLVGYISGYVYGTKQYIASPEPQRMHDLEQPWEIAVRNTKYGEKVVVITKNNEEITGKIERIGSPSEDYDLLLFAAERATASGEPEPLGMTYHHYRDISRVQFPNLKPTPNKKGNLLAEKYELLRDPEYRQQWAFTYYYKFLLKYKLKDGFERATKLQEYLQSKYEN